MRQRSELHQTDAPLGRTRDRPDTAVASPEWVRADPSAPITVIFTAIPDVLVEFGAAIRNGAQLEMTPLGRWAWQKMHAQRREPQQPAEHGDVGRGDAALSEQLLHVAVGQIQWRSYQRIATMVTFGGSGIQQSSIEAEVYDESNDAPAQPVRLVRRQRNSAWVSGYTCLA